MDANIDMHANRMPEVRGGIWLGVDPLAGDSCVMPFPFFLRLLGNAFPPMKTLCAISGLRRIAIARERRVLGCTLFLQEYWQKRCGPAIVAAINETRAGKGQ
jgi:hypothetical protein